MNSIVVELSSVGKKEFSTGISVIDVIYDMLVGRFTDILAARINGNLVDLSYIIESDCVIDLITFDDEDGKYILRHSAAHIMAQAIKRLHGDVKYAAGPPLENGFYYDMSLSGVLNEDDFTVIEKEMQNIVDSNYVFHRSQMSIDDAISFFSKSKDLFKLHFLEKFKLNGISNISCYKQGEFIDLCRGPHIFSTGQLKAFKLLKISGAYWKNDCNNIQLQRIYGTAFFSQDALIKYINILEESKLRDHRKIAKDQNLFSFCAESPGSVIWQEKGMVIYNTIIDFIRKENAKRNYKEVKTPLLFDESLWVKSGHVEHFQDNMYFTRLDNRQFAIKPMNCPGHCLIYKSSIRSYRDLPFKLSEFGLVHRNELSGVLHGLFRLRSFTQDDAHIFCSYDDIKLEVKNIIDYTLYVYKFMGFDDYDISISTRPESYIGSDFVWEKATNSLKNALYEYDIDYNIKQGEGAFYGPKIEFNIRDSLSRKWQCGTVQIDFSMPEKLGLTYEGSDGKKHLPVIIHRAVLGSIERFIGVLIEHYAGRLPFWLVPVQVILISILDKHVDYLMKVEKNLLGEGLRIEKDLTNEKLGYKIRKAQLKQIPYMVIIGDKELKNKKLSVRKLEGANVSLCSVGEFIETLRACLS